jgi:hypothetical protein
MVAGTTADAALATLRHGLEGHDEQAPAGAYANDAAMIAPEAWHE